MKGVVLAGGTGSRLFPLTKITNKHLLPIYDRPMIYYPIQTLVDAGIRDIMIVTGGRNSGDFLRLLANGKEFGLKHINYTYQEGEGGIADALALAEHFADGQKICVMLGDNIIEGSIRAGGRSIPGAIARARIFCSRKCRTPSGSGWRRYRAARSSASRRSPLTPRSNYAVTGIYMYDATVFDKIKTLVPSGRGELEITDVNNAYIREGSMTFSFLEGWWTDAGTFDSLLRAANLVAQSVGRRRWQRAARCWSDGAAELMAEANGGAGAWPPWTAWNWRSRMPEGIGALIGAPDSPDLIEGVRVQPFPVYPDDRGYFLEVQRIGRGLAAAFPPETHARFRRRSATRATIKAFHYHLHQTDCWTPAMGMLQVALVDLRLGSPHLRPAQHHVCRRRCAPGRC